MSEFGHRASRPQALRKRLVALRYMLVGPGFRRRLLQDMLTLFGVNSVAHSPSLHDACHAIWLHRPDLVLWDWDAPDLDGLKQLHRECLSMPNRPVIIVLAAAPSPELVAAVVLAGAAGIVAKPFSTNAVMSQVAHALANRTREYLID
jgi:AmiR/NasT family two-component response regulator